MRGASPGKPCNCDMDKSGMEKKKLNWEHFIAVGAIAGILAHLVMRFLLRLPPDLTHIPLLVVLFGGGAPLVIDLAAHGLKLEFGSDLLAGISILSSFMLGEYLAGSLVVLMLSGGKALETYAVRSASSVLEALSKRMPHVAHVQRNGAFADVQLGDVAVGDLVRIFPHEICPVDGEVIEGHGAMDESYLTGEPFRMSKTPGTAVISGAINGDRALTIKAKRLAVDSRYARITGAMREAQQRRPKMRRLGDALGSWYTPLAVVIAVAAWLLSGNSHRFLAVLVVATPCPLLIAIPVAMIGSISLAAKRAIVVRDPAVLEQIDRCSVMILDKTGTLTYGKPLLTEQLTAKGVERVRLLSLVASLEQYSKHPLAGAVLAAAKVEGISLIEAVEIQEAPGEGLRGLVEGVHVMVTSRSHVLEAHPEMEALLPPAAPGLECVILLEGSYAGIYRFHDAPRRESRPFISHLGTRHRFTKIMLVSGDREPETRYLAQSVGVQEVFASKSPEEKVAIVRDETAKAKTLFIGDGINDAPALMTATVGIALGPHSEVTTQSAGAVIMESSLTRVDEFMHIGTRMRSIALQSAVGGMLLSTVGMAAAAWGYLTPVEGALAQEFIDILAIVNALRAALPPRRLDDIT